MEGSHKKLRRGDAVLDEDWRREAMDGVVVKTWAEGEGPEPDSEEGMNTESDSEDGGLDAIFQDIEFALFGLPLDLQIGVLNNQLQRLRFAQKISKSKGLEQSESEMNQD